MREFVVIVLVGFVCLLAPFNPRIGVLGYVWFGLMRPDILAWSRITFYSQAIAIACLLGCLLLASKIRLWITNPITVTLLVLVCIISLSAVLAIQPSLSVPALTEYLKMILMVLLIPLVIRSELHFKQLLLVMGISVGIVGFKYGIWGIFHGGARFDYGVGGFMSDNNTMAVGLAMSIPLCWYGRQLSSNKWLKWMLLLLVIGSASAIVMTHSRGGALCLAISCLIMVMYSRRKTAALLLVVLAIGPAVYLVSDSYVSRLKTLNNPDEESSAYSRIVYAKAALKLWRDYPLIGVGFGTHNQRAVWNRYVDDSISGEDGQVVHNTYLQMLVDSGIIAFVIYLTLLWGTILYLGFSIKRTRRDNSGLEVYPMMLQTSLIAFAVGSAFLSQVRFDFLYMLLISAAIWKDISSSSSSIKFQGDEIAGNSSEEHMNAIQSHAK